MHREHTDARDRDCLPPGRSLIVIGALSALSWALLIGLFAGIRAML